MRKAIEEMDDMNVPEPTDPAIRAKKKLLREDLLMWAFYRHDSFDYTQQEAHEAAKGAGPSYAQSTVSRRLSSLDDDVLTKDLDDVPNTPVFTYEEHIKPAPDAVLEAERTRICEAILQERAFTLCHEPSIDAPEWARERFPELADWSDKQ